MTTKQTDVVKFLESLVGTRVSEESLNKTLSKYFGEDIKIHNATQDRLDGGDDDELSDWNYMFNSDKEETFGYFDIYILPMRQEGLDGSTMYITEISYEFDGN